MGVDWYLWFSSLLWTWSVVSGHPCNIDKKGWAACNGKKLLHAPNSLPRYITNLDLSFNSLMMPRNGTLLQSLSFLRSLNLSSNTIPTLYSALFLNLRVLHLLDLSNCSISYMHPKSFLGLRSLHTLFLKNNKLHSLDSSVFLISGTLVHLDLRNNELSDADELAQFIRIRHVKLQGNPWVYNDSITPFQQGSQHREDKQILFDSHPELQTQEMRTLKQHHLSHQKKLRAPRAEPQASSAPSGNETSTTPPPQKAAITWPYFAGFVLSAVGISILIALITKCKLQQKNRASYHHHRLPDSRSVGSSHAEEADMDVAYGRSQAIPRAAGCHAEDDDGFIEDNYIEPSHSLHEDDELEPHFKL